MNTRSSNIRPLDFVAQSVGCSLEFVVGDCHGQSLLAVEYCLGVQNNKDREGAKGRLYTDVLV
jgi:hypothetical protein